MGFKVDAEINGAFLNFIDAANTGSQLEAPDLSSAVTSVFQRNIGKLPGSNCNPKASDLLQSQSASSHKRRYPDHHGLGDSDSMMGQPLNRRKHSRFDIASSNSSSSSPLDPHSETSSLALALDYFSSSQTGLSLALCSPKTPPSTSQVLSSISNTPISQVGAGAASRGLFSAVSPVEIMSAGGTSLSSGLYSFDLQLSSSSNQSGPAQNPTSVCPVEPDPNDAIFIQGVERTILGSPSPCSSSSDSEVLNAAFQPSPPSLLRPPANEASQKIFAPSLSIVNCLEKAKGKDKEYYWLRQAALGEFFKNLIISDPRRPINYDPSQDANQLLKDLLAGLKIYHSGDKGRKEGTIKNVYLINEQRSNKTQLAVYADIEIQGSLREKEDLYAYAIKVEENQFYLQFKEKRFYLVKLTEKRGFKHKKNVFKIWELSQSHKPFQSNRPEIVFPATQNRHGRVFRCFPIPKKSGTDEPDCDALKALQEKLAKFEISLNL